MHPDHIRGLGKRQTALHEEVIGPITEFRNCEIFWPRHLLENTFEKSFDSAPGPQPHVPRLLKASSNLSLAEERGLDDPAGLTI